MIYLGLQAILIPGVGNLGTVGFPVNILCKLRGVYDYAFCCVCNQDCIVVHGTYGGKCGPDPKNPKEFKCLCAETEKEAKDRKIYPSSRDTCAGFPLGKLPYDIGKKLVVTFRIRNEPWCVFFMEDIQ